MKEYLVTEIFNERINIKYNMLNTTNMNDIIYKILNKKLGNKCYKDGFIFKNNIKLISKTLGNIETNIIYNIKFSAESLKISINDTIDCYIDNINKMGIIAYIKLKDILNNYDETNTILESPLIIIIPTENIDDIKKYNINQTIKINVNAFRIKYNSDKIQIVGKII